MRSNLKGKAAAKKVIFSQFWVPFFPTQQNSDKKVKHPSSCNAKGDRSLAESLLLHLLSEKPRTDFQGLENGDFVSLSLIPAILFCRIPISTLQSVASRPLSDFIRFLGLFKTFIKIT